MATILGAVPLALAGAASRHHIGVIIIGGVLVFTVLTLVVVPCLYTYCASVTQSDWVN